MPKIDFYILPEGTPENNWEFICRIIEKIYKQKHRIYVHTENEKMAFHLDELLWTYRADSFLPHNLYGEGPDTTPPIQIGFDVVPQNQRDILINLSGQIPNFYPQFHRLLEIVMHDAQAQESARERFRFYRAQGFEMNTHKLQTAEV